MSTHIHVSQLVTGSDSLYTVPAGKRFLGNLMIANTSNSATATVNISLNGVEYLTNFILQKNATGYNNHFMEKTGIVLTAAGAITINVTAGSVRATVMGLLEDL